MTREDKIIIEQIVISIKNEYKLPTIIKLEDLYNFIKKLGGYLIEIDNDINSYFPLVKKENNSFYIYIEKNINEKFKKYLISCALGYVFIHMGFLISDSLWEKAINYMGRTDMYKIEMQFIEFAHNLLLPKKEFIKIMHMNFNVSTNAYNIKKIAKYFSVDEEIVISRGLGLNLLKYN